MELQHINVKIPVDGPPPELGRVIDLFHGWIQKDALGEFLIDVADYRHVPGGPGVLLVGHEGDYSLDLDGGPGLRYNRKAPLAGDNAARLAQAVTSATRACALLESALGVRFSRKQLDVWINDRALAPHTPETLAEVRPAIEALLGPVTLEPQADLRRLFGVRVTLSRPLTL